MSVVGHLLPSHPGKLDHLTGSISTLHISMPIEVGLNPRCTTDRTPTHRISTRTGHGQPTEIGKAWLRTVRAGQHAGKPFMSLTIDDPSFPRPLNLAAYPRDDDDGWDIVFRRRSTGPAIIVGE